MTATADRLERLRGTFPYLRAQQFGIGFPSAAGYSAMFASARCRRRRLPRDLPGRAKRFQQAQLDAFRDESGVSARFSALAHARQGKRKTFLYHFSHRPPPPPTGPDRGATHGAEIHTRPMLRAEWRDEDRRLAVLMSSYWFTLRRVAIRMGPSCRRGRISFPSC